jgi:hypothetical protein
MLSGLAACAAPERPAPAPDFSAPQSATPALLDASPSPRARVAAPARDPATAALYAGVEAELVASGRMRQERAPPDAPFGIPELVRNFERIALYDEYVDLGGRFVRRETPALLRRWEGPIRVGVVTSAATPPAQAAEDRASVAAFTRRLAALTGADMALSEGPDVNFLVMFLGQGDLAGLRALPYPRFADLDPAALRSFRDTPPDTFCTAFAFGTPEAPSVYSTVLVLIKAEHPPLTRRSCVEEEMAQAMGLPNDSPEARPSLFSDRLEFALLTEHDAILLRMLYDPRLRPGMTVAEVRPLLPAIAADAVRAHQAELIN